MKLLGVLSDYLRSVFKKDGQDITLRPNNSTTFSAAQTLDLPPPDGDNADVLVGEDATQTLVNKTIDADSNTVSNIENADIKAGAAIDADKIHDGSVSNTEFGYLDGVTSGIQGQIDGKADTSHTHDTADIVSGTFDDARIAESNVTQHQAALSVTESQISDLQDYTLDVMTTRGDLIRRGAASEERLSLGSSGQVLQSDGTDAVWADPASSGFEVESQNSSFTAADKKHYLVDSSAGAITVTMPSGASGLAFRVSDSEQTASTNNITITPASGEQISGLAINESLILDVDTSWVQLSWDNTNSWWVYDTLSASLENKLPNASTDNAIARFDGTAGIVQDSGITIDDSDNIAGATSINFGDSNLGHYDEGTFTLTPVSQTNLTGLPTITEAAYTRIGRIVFVTVTFTSTASNANLQSNFTFSTGDLPYAPKLLAGRPIVMGYSQNLDSPSEVFTADNGLISPASGTLAIAYDPVTAALRSGNSMFAYIVA